MKKYSLIYLLSFLSYIFIWISLLNVSDGLWTVWLFVISIIYQLLYIFILRKKDGVSFRRSISRYYLYFLIVLCTIIIGGYISVFFNGYSVCKGVMTYCSEPYYGFEAWVKMEDNSIFIPLIVLSMIYFIRYYNNYKKTKKSNK